MDGRERREEQSLPADYVSLAQLQERWLKKQQEKKKQEEEKKNDGHEKMVGGSVRDVFGRKVEKDGGEMGVIDGKGKGKQVVVGGFENGEENEKKNMKKKRNRHSRKMKSAGKEMEEVGIEKQVENEVEIVSGNGLKGIKEIERVSVVEVLPGVKGEISGVKRRDSRGGFGRNGGNQGSRYNRRNEYGGRFNDQLKQSEGASALEKRREDGKGYDKKWRESGRNGEYRERYDRMKDSKPDVLKGNKVEPELEKKAENEILEVFSEKCGLSGRDRDGVRGQSINARNKTKEDRVEGEGSSDDRGAKKVDHEVLVVESGKYGLSGRDRDGVRRHSNNRRNKTKEDKVEGEGLSDDRGAMVKKVDHEVLVVESEKYGLSGRDRDGVQGHSNYERNKPKEDRVEGEGLSDDRGAMVKKLDHEVLVVESEKYGEKGGVGKGYRRYGNPRGYYGDGEIGGVGKGYMRYGNVRRYYGDGRRYTGFGRFDDRNKMKQFGRFDDRHKMKQRESGKMWVKKEDKSGADAAELISSGISVDHE